MADKDLLLKVAGISEHELREVLALVNGTEIEELEVGIHGGHLKVRRRIADESRPPSLIDSPAEHEDSETGGGLTVASPLVGIFHPLVAEGDAVKLGQPLGRIEAMGMPTNVEAPQAGRVGEILAADGTGVEYGQPLLTLYPDDTSE